MALEGKFLDLGSTNVRFAVSYGSYAAGVGTEGLGTAGIWKRPESISVYVSSDL